ncbi:triple tyrosine motif-containing protein [Luteibacter sp. 329MFSha]|uniref:sensor histidine kinase n=1 Tax=Luteibacter sp. 329MFSha TaxID=1798239 RepID=UPI0008BF1D2E|nr:triple tyrosine motif-containing protein [Luteibacter sp. 329MFSha]SEV92307.1 Histidine kinase [Luteibacter sp. 329MFSha]
MRIERLIPNIFRWLAWWLTPTTVVATGVPPAIVQPAQYVHQTWTIQDGAPPAICAIAQGPDGYLWLGTGSGLYRFDGVEFSRYQPSSGQHLVATNLTALAFMRDGGLWIGSYDGGATHLKNGTLRSSTTRDGFPPGWVYGFAEGLDGEVWAASGQGLGRFDGTHWRTIGRDWNFPVDRADWVAVDREGTLWVAAVNRLVYLPRGAKRFQSTNVALAPGATMAIDGKGTLWISDRLHGTRPLPDLSASHPLATDPDRLPVSAAHAAARMTFDHGGSLWATALDNAAVFRVARDALPGAGENVVEATIGDRFEAPLSLTANTAIPVAVDREGTVWVGTGLGLDSYHRGPVGSLRDFHLAPKTHLGIGKDAAGRLWLSDSDRIYRLDGDRFTTVVDGIPDTVLGVFHQRDDTLWIIGFHDLYRYDGGRLAKVPLPGHLYASRLKFVASAPDGAVWTSIEGLGVHRWVGGAWKPWRPRSGDLEASPTTGAVADDGSVWLGFGDGALLHVDPSGAERVYRFEAGREIGPVNTIASTRSGVIFGGSAGLATLRNGQLTSLTDRDFAALTGVTGIAQTRDGEVWVNAGRGVVRFGDGELGRAFDDAAYRPALRVFDFRDGIAGSARQGQPVGTMALDDAGRLWFLTNENAYWLDPAALGGNRLRPPVYIRSIVANEKAFPLSASVDLPAGVSTLEIGYTALSLTSPSRVRFRYRLVGEDAAWIDPGTRRKAYYTNLGPGDYRFEVIGSNDQDVWNERGATVSLSIAPHFWQTWWFRAVVALLLLALVGLAYVSRTRAMAREIRVQASVRHEERERIARDLHDTLLQAIYGIILKFQSIAATLRDDDPLRKQLDDSLRLASDFVVEGRDRVRELRARIESTGELLDAIGEVARVLRQASPIPIDTSMHVADHAMDPAVADEVLSIVREALINAVRHAQASRIEASLTASERGIVAHVRDDGQGMAATLIDGCAADAGRWGITGMRERAARIGALFDIASSPRGTDVSIAAPLRLPTVHARVRTAGRRVPPTSMH